MKTTMRFTQIITILACVAGTTLAYWLYATGLRRVSPAAA